MIVVSFAGGAAQLKEASDSLTEQKRGNDEARELRNKRAVFDRLLNKKGRQLGKEMWIST